jgi:hypothetical protein
MATVFQPVGAKGALAGVLSHAAVPSAARPAHWPCANAALVGDIKRPTATAAARPLTARVCRSCALKRRETRLCMNHFSRGFGRMEGGPTVGVTDPTFSPGVWGRYKSRARRGLVGYTRMCHDSLAKLPFLPEQPADHPVADWAILWTISSSLTQRHSD